MVGGVILGYCLMGKVNSLMIFIIIIEIEIIVDRMGCFIKVFKFIVFFSFVLF